MSSSLPSPVAFRPVQTKESQLATDKLNLEKVINVSFMSMMDTPDLSSVYRVRSGDTARSIVTMALKKRLNREPIVSEIESYLHEVREMNANIDNLKIGDVFMLPIDHEHALSHQVRKPGPSADITRKVIEAANTPRPANVQLLIAPPGLSAAPGRCIKDDGLIRMRTAAAPEVDDETESVTYSYQGELASSFLGLFRAFFKASETRTSAGQLLANSIEYDGFGTSLKFMTIAGVIELSLVRTIKTTFDERSNLYETVVVCSDGMTHTLASSPDGSRSWRVLTGACAE
ncbi:MAG TPA: hypothetical protein V6C89_07515 [Drouetiella sp.]|jgi:hypothetical protein